MLPIADRHADAADEVGASAAAAGLRAEVDDRTESVGRKIRDAELRKIPYMLVVGDREAEDGTVAVRRHGGEGDEGVAAVERARRAARGRALPRLAVTRRLAGGYTSTALTRLAFSTPCRAPLDARRTTAS